LPVRAAVLQGVQAAVGGAEQDDRLAKKRAAEGAVADLVGLGGDVQ
jgi:hypothetical protein